MLFTYLITILAAIGGLVLVLSLAVAIAYVILANRLSRGMRQAVDELGQQLAEAMMAAARATHSQGSQQVALVPPMRIHLEPATRPWEINPLAERIDTWLRQHGFNHAGDYVIDELGSEGLRVFLGEDDRLLAAIRFTSGSSEPYVEFCVDLGHGRRGGVSNPPSGTLQLPSDAVGSYHAESLSTHFELLSRMWLEIKDLMDEHDLMPIGPSRIAEFFEEAHASEMDFRIAQGGISEKEIQAAFAAQGVAPGKEDIAAIQAQWQQAIERHVLDFSSRAQNHHIAGGQILVVHDGSVRSYLLNRMLDMLDQMEGREGVSHEQLLSTLGELRGLLNRFSPREAMARFRPLLPACMRYKLVDQLKQPVEADLYLLQPTP